MGQILTQFAHERRSLNEISFFSDKSLSKIEEFREIYHNISDSFSIDDTEFRDIFGEFHPVFDILDTSCSLLIDGLEVFTALPLFSKLIKLESKIEFIFKLFDFNGLKSLSSSDMEFMVLTCCSSTHKLLGIKSELQEDIVFDYVQEEFGSTQKRINISQAIKWALTSPMVSKFIGIIYNEDENIFKNGSEIKEERTLLSLKLYRSYQTCSRNELGSLLSANYESLSFDKISQKETRKWLIENRKLIDSENQQVKSKIKEKIPDGSDITLIPQWVYGIRYRDVKYFIDFINENEIVYFIGKVVVLLNIKSSKQKHYLEHDQEVICIAQNNSKHEEHYGMIATSEIISKDEIDEKFPVIRIWNSKTLKTEAVISGQHKIGVHLMKFSSSGQFLITCGVTFYSAVVVYNTRDKFKPIYDISCHHPTVEISPIVGIIDESCDDFVIATLYGVKYFEIIEKKGLAETEIEIVCHKLSNVDNEGGIEKNGSTYEYGSFSEITCCCFIHTNETLKYLSGYDQGQEKIVLTGHEKGEVNVWSITYGSILWDLCTESSEITGIVPSISHILISSNSSVVNFWDIDLKKKKKLLQVDLTTLDLQLQGYEISAIVEKPNLFPEALTQNYTQSEYLLTSSKGEVFILSLKPKEDKSLRFKLIGPRYKSNHINKIFAIGEVTTFKVLEKQNGENLLLFGGSDGVLHIVDGNTKIRVTSWKIGEEIVAMDCIETKEDIEIVVGTALNHIYLNSNFVEKNIKYEAERSIKCLKMIVENGHSILILGLEGGHLHFMNIDDSHEKKGLVRGASVSQIGRRVTQSRTEDNPNVFLNRMYENENNVVRKIKLASSPTEILCLEKKMLLVSTEENIFYIVSLKDYHFKIIEPESNPLSSLFIKNKCIKIFFSLSKFPKSQTKNSHTIYKLPVMLSKNEKFTIAASMNGTINLWKNLTDNVNENKLTYNWHASRCINFILDKEQTSLFTCGYEDGMLIDSSLLKFYEVCRKISEPLRAITSSASILTLQSRERNNDCFMDGEIEFSTFNEEITSQTYDQHILVRGLENETLNRLFKGMSEQWRIINKEIPHSQPPKISLSLDHVYGIETDNKRSTVFALNLPYTQFVYFVSNVVIVYDPMLNAQRIYRGHRCRISCISKIALSQEKLSELTPIPKIPQISELTELIVSAESCQFSVVKIWHPQTLETLQTFETSHQFGIIHLSATSTHILTYGLSIKPNIFSLEIVEIKSRRVIGYRNIEQVVYCMSLSVLGSQGEVEAEKGERFVTGGKGGVIFWRAKGSNIDKEMVIDVDGTVTSCAFWIVEEAQPYLSSFEPCQNWYEELIVGLETGELGMINNGGKFLIVEEKAHQKCINSICFINWLKIDEHGQVNVKEFNSVENRMIKYIVTCSEDESIRIWSKCFRLEFEQEIRKIEFEDKLGGIGGINHTDPRYIPQKGNLHTHSHSNVSWNISSEKTLSKNVSIQSLSPIYSTSIGEQLSILLATRNGDIIVMKESIYVKGYEHQRKISQPKKHEKRMSVEYAGEEKEFDKDAVDIRKKSQTKMLKTVERKRSAEQKSSFISHSSKPKLKLQERSSLGQMSSFFRENSRHPKQTSDIIQKSELDPPLLETHPLSSLKFVLYLRSHSSQISPSTKPEYLQFSSQSKTQVSQKVLFSHHPKFDIIATISSDQNLMFWDTERNMLILNRMLGYLAQPTAIKFTKDGEILIIGYSDGRVLWLDSAVTKAHQGKADEKFNLPSLRILMEDKSECPVLGIEQSESGDHLAISYNNKPPQHQSTQSSQVPQSPKEKSHISIFLNKSRDRVRAHNLKIEHNIIFELITTIPCQSDSLYTTELGSKYGIATHSMNFTENEGKIYLLIYEQLVDVYSMERLNCNKDGNYLIWDVNTSTMIANLDLVANLNWKRLSVPNSIYARYLEYENFTLKEEFLEKDNLAQPNPNLLIPYISTMANLPNHILLGSINGDVHIVQSSCLEYEEMLERVPSRGEMFIGKSFGGHCSEVNQMEFSMDRSLLYTSGIAEKCVFKWKVEGDFNLQFGKTPQNRLGTIQLQDNMEDNDIFSEVPSRENIQNMLELYRFKNSAIVDHRRVGDFMETFRIIDVEGRRAADVRGILWYDIGGRIVYGSGHVGVVIGSRGRVKTLKEKDAEERHSIRQLKSYRYGRKYESTEEVKTDEPREFLYIVGGIGGEPAHEISYISLSHDRELLYTAHSGLTASISTWQLSTRIRLRTIVLTKICYVLIVRPSFDNKNLLVYGIDQSHIPYLILLDIMSGGVIGVATFIHEQPYLIKDMKFYPGSNSKFITCGIEEVLSWKLLGGKLVYGIMECSAPDVNQNLVSNQNTAINGSLANYGQSSYSSGNRKSISLCVEFLARSKRVVSGCEDGNLIFWGENSQQRREHTNMITVLKSCSPNILLSGSSDGLVLLWIEEMSSSGLVLCSKLTLRGENIARGINTKEEMEEREREGKGVNMGKRRDFEISLQSIDILNVYGETELERAEKAQAINLEEQRLKNLKIGVDKEGNDLSTRKHPRSQPPISPSQSSSLQSQFPPQSHLQTPKNLEQNPTTHSEPFVPQKWLVLLGSSSGSIYETSFSQETRIKITFDEADITVVKKFYDHESPQSFFFTKDDKEIYEIRRNGGFCIRRVSDSRVILEKSFNMEAVDILHSPNNNLFYIVFKTQIECFSLFKASNSLESLTSLCTLQQKNITHAQISTHERVVAVGIIKNSDKTVCVEVYDVTDVREKSTIKYLVNFAMPLNEEISFIDLSENNRYLVVGLGSGKIVGQDLVMMESVGLDTIESMRWRGQAQILYGNNKKLIDQIGDLGGRVGERKGLWGVSNILELSSTVFIIISDNGSIYAYNNQGEILGESRIKISDCSVVRLSESKKLFGIGSEIDRNFIIFDLGVLTNREAKDDRF